MEGPYRDLGSGFARLTGVEGVRRGPSTIHFVEDALFEMLQNAFDAGAENIYVASSLRARRFRTLTVLDDGHGIPEPYKDLVFEPGVTTRHLEPALTASATTKPTNGSGLSLYHIKNSSVEARVLSLERPTSLQVTFDTRETPERALQSATRTSRSNLRGTAQSFLADCPPNTKPIIYYGSPATILAILVKNRIIHTSSGSPGDKRWILEEGRRLGLGVSMRTVQRIEKGKTDLSEALVASEAREHKSVRDGGQPSDNFVSQSKLELSQEEIYTIAAILGEAARTRYLEVGELEVESRPGEILVRSRIYEPEEEYE